MLDQDTARALLTIADETGARVAFVGDRHQLPAVGRGGVLDHAVAWAHPTAVVTLEKVHRFTDPDYAAMSLRMRTGDDPGGVFDALHRRGQVVIHASEVERTAALADAGASGRPGHRRHPRTGRRPQRRHPRPPPARPEQPRGRSPPLAAIGSGSVTGSRPDATTPTSRSRTARPGPSPASGRTAASLLHGQRTRSKGPARVCEPVRRARLRHHRPRRPGRHRRCRARPDRRHERSRVGVRRDDPWPRAQHRAPRRRGPRRRPPAVGRGVRP